MNRHCTFYELTRLASKRIGELSDPQYVVNHTNKCRYCSYRVKFLTSGIVELPLWDDIGPVYIEDCPVGCVVRLVYNKMSYCEYPCVIRAVTEDRKLGIYKATISPLHYFPDLSLSGDIIIDEPDSRFCAMVVSALTFEVPADRLDLVRPLGFLPQRHISWIRTLSEGKIPDETDPEWLCASVRTVSYNKDDEREVLRRRMMYALQQ